MVTILVERSIAAAPARVWAFVDDVGQLVRWFPFVDEAEVLEGEGAGRRQRLYGNWGKQRSEIDQRVTAYDPPRLIAWTHEAERLDGNPAPKFARSTDVRIALESVATGTRVYVESRQIPADPLRGVVMFLGRRRIRKAFDRSPATLERLVSESRQREFGD